MKYNILVVEDNKEINKVLSNYLQREGYLSTVVEDGFQALEVFDSQIFHLVLLDVMLPGIDGFEILKRIRDYSQIPVIIITAKILEPDRIRGFDIGADDYVVKPFSTRELMLRVKVLLKRIYKKDKNGILNYKDLVLDSKRMVVVNSGNNITLTTTEFLLLETFMKNIGLVLSRNQLIQEAFGYNYEAYNRNIDTYVKKLRKKLAPKDYIQTKYGYGYKFGDSYDN